MNFNKGRSRSKRSSMKIVNSEKWRNYGKKTSRNNTQPMNDDSDDDEPKYNEIKDWVQDFFEKKCESEDRTDQDVEVQLTQRQTLILSTLVPDEILLIDKFDQSDPKRFVGVLLMADVSGYTALSERYNNTGKGGTYRLTVTLNTYLGSLIELIYTHGGDILKFAGDAFLALWKTDKRTFLCHTIHNVIACALLIQHSYSSYETDVKVNLRVKLAISAGNIMFAPIGSGIDMNYVIFGLPVLEAKVAESVCSSGEVKLSKTAWGHCYSRNYDHVIDHDGHVTIKSILYDPHESDVNKPFPGFGVMVKQIKRPLNAIENLPDFLLEPNKSLSPAEVLKKSEVLNLRKTIFTAEEKNIGSEIRKFMIRPVLTQIDAHQPLEYLTEMRQVSILFITLKPRDCPFLQLITIVDNAYKITCEIVYKSMGCVNKIILFDKDIMILVVFGLRGFKHESEAQAALKCAYSIKKSVSALDGVVEVSIGVTTGQVYCGVVGHPLRREFTVIGAIVNKAARLMCGFRNKITCDEATFVKSKMSTNGFTLQPKIELKGIEHSGKIYEYTEDIRVKELYDIPMMPALLDRHDEMEYYQNWLNDSHQTFRDFDALLLVGESRIGKTRLLEWMARYARNSGHHVCFVTLSTIHSATPYLALNQIINQILGLDEPIVGFIKEEKIVQLMKVYTEDLCYLNNILKVRFAFHERIYSYDEHKRKEKGKVIFTKLIKALPETQIVFMDDLQNLDAFSWEFISLMFCSMKIFTIMSVSRGKLSSVHNWLYSVFISNNVRKMVLGALTPSLITALACQILDVTAVPKDLCDALMSKCDGMPGLVESFIIHLFSNGALELKKILENEIEDWAETDLQFPDFNLLHPQALDVKDQVALDEFIEKDNTGELGICIVTQKEELKTNINVQNLDALIMIQIDSLTPYQQLLLKIGSVIGNVVSRDLLESIMYENNPLTTAKAIKRLFAMRILSCATSNNAKGNRKATLDDAASCTINMNLMCDCSFEYDPENSDNLPKYSFCKVIKFKNKNLRKTCYELLPLNQKKEFHSRIINYLENNKLKCPTCGGIVMIVQSLLNLVTNDSFSCSMAKSQSGISYSSDIDDDNPSIELNSPSCTSEKIVREQYEINNKEIIKSNSEEILTRDTSTGSSYMNNVKTQHNSILKTKSSEVEEDLNISRRSTKRVTMTDNHLKNDLKVDEFTSYKVFDMLRQVTEAETVCDWHNLGILDSKDDLVAEKEEKNNARKALNVKIERNISQTDFSKCTCADLHIAIYEQLIHHALQAELKDKAIEFIITSSYLNLLANNLDIIFPKLEEAEKMCFKDHGTLEALFKKRCLGKIHSLRAAACLMSGRFEASKIALERALKVYRINLGKVTGVLQIKGAINSIKMKMKRYRAYKITMQSDSVFCLNVATLLNLILGEQRMSKLTAVRALQIIRDVECPVVDICDAFSNALIVELNRGTPEATVEIEKMASQTLKRLARPIQADELYAVGKFFVESFRARLARGQLAPAIRSGFRALTVSRFLQANNVSLDIIPDLFYVLLSRRRIEEAIDILQLAFRMGNNQISQDSETWYYALCIDMVLDAGFQLESPMEISRFAEFALNRGKSAGPGRRRLVVGLWTYWLRADAEKRARRFESEALGWASSEDDDGTITTLISAMRLADGMLESLARKVDDLRKVIFFGNLSKKGYLRTFRAKKGADARYNFVE
ncbi:putative soluble adenylyl cyclase [Operophtera brumata]|uniref:Putative soluble adenylyl cyclase n=1 Tax=Operophtera brumata TaxID=104452 RepID=A0A0L7LP99_OPEBR|nr:putative soluble adenylyl cyclase [Operophtera brumata]